MQSSDTRRNYMENLEKISVDELNAKAETCYKAGDSETALKYYRAAADKGNSHAMYEIGYIYTYGKGVEMNVSEAVEYTLMAAELGDVDG